MITTTKKAGGKQSNNFNLPMAQRRPMASCCVEGTRPATLRTAVYLCDADDFGGRKGLTG